MLYHIYLIIPTKVNGKVIKLKVKSVQVMFNVREVYSMYKGKRHHIHTYIILKPSAATSRHKKLFTT